MRDFKESHGFPYILLYCLRSPFITISWSNLVFTLKMNNFYSLAHLWKTKTHACNSTSQTWKHHQKKFVHIAYRTCIYRSKVLATLQCLFSTHFWYLVPITKVDPVIAPSYIGGFEWNHIISKNTKKIRYRETRFKKNDLKRKKEKKGQFSSSRSLLLKIN